MKSRKAKKGFTLVELLVVISVIALLLAILMPSLNKAREVANRIVCGQNLKTLGTASTTYAHAYNGYYVPLSFYAYGPNPVNNQTNEPAHFRWLNNSSFASYIEKKAYTGDENVAFENPYAMPKEMLCPSDKISKDPSNAAIQESVLCSYAYNGTEWDFKSRISKEDKNPRISYCGHRVDSLKSPADKLQFTDSVDWWCNWRGADYRIGWDVLGQTNLIAYKKAIGAVHGPVLYRHNEGANVGFYDGHVEHLKKTEIFNKDDYDATTKPKWAGMWTASGWF
jgi:prepilin-type N-terminal cleavage/methylation domain-containing protein/prepilin-type processing-associated H-X9-DG protein